MADHIRHADYVLYDVLYLGDLKITFGRSSRRNWVRVESLSGAKLPEFASTPEAATKIDQPAPLR